MDLNFISLSSSVWDNTMRDGTKCSSIFSDAFAVEER
jgi:hypothetical protein